MNIQYDGTFRDKKEAFPLISVIGFVTIHLQGIYTVVIWVKYQWKVWSILL